jgi:hypothetical protein
MRPSHLVLVLSSALAACGGFMIYQAKTHVVTNETGIQLIQPVHFVTHQMEVETTAMGNRREPEIRATSELGKPVVLASPTAPEPQFILFIKNDCPCSINAQPIFNDLARKFKNTIGFDGVIDGSTSEAKNYASQFSVAFPVVGDQSLNAIHKFGALAGVYSALVARNGHLIKMWPGYCADMLADMNHMLSAAGGSKETPFDPEYAPKKKTTGCAYEAGWQKEG